MSGSIRYELVGWSCPGCGETLYCKPGCPELQKIALSNFRPDAVEPDELTTLRAQLSASEARVAEAYEECARIVDVECERVMATQMPTAAGMDFNDSVNLNIRMMVALFPELSASIRRAAAARAKKIEGV